MTRREESHASENMCVLVYKQKQEHMKILILELAKEEEKTIYANPIAKIKIRELSQFHFHHFASESNLGLLACHRYARVFIYTHLYERCLRDKMLIQRMSRNNFESLYSAKEEEIELKGFVS